MRFAPSAPAAVAGVSRVPSAHSPHSHRERLRVYSFGGTCVRSPASFKRPSYAIVPRLSLPLSSERPGQACGLPNPYCIISVWLRQHSRAISRIFYPYFKQMSAFTAPLRSPNRRFVRFRRSRCSSPRRRARWFRSRPARSCRPRWPGRHCHGCRRRSRPRRAAGRR